MSPMFKNRGQAREAGVWQQQATRGLESQGQAMNQRSVNTNNGHLTVSAKLFLVLISADGLYKDLFGIEDMTADLSQIIAHKVPDIRQDSKGTFAESFGLWAVT